MGDVVSTETFDKEKQEAIIKKCLEEKKEKELIEEKEKKEEERVEKILDDLITLPLDGKYLTVNDKQIRIDGKRLSQLHNNNILSERILMPHIIIKFEGEDVIAIPVIEKSITHASESGKILSKFRKEYDEYYEPKLTISLTYGSEHDPNGPKKKEFTFLCDRNTSSNYSYGRNEYCGMIRNFIFETVVEFLTPLRTTEQSRVLGPINLNDTFEKVNDQNIFFSQESDSAPSYQNNLTNVVSTLIVEQPGFITKKYYFQDERIAMEVFKTIESYCRPLILRTEQSPEESEMNYSIFYKKDSFAKWPYFFGIS